MDVYEVVVSLPDRKYLSRDYKKIVTCMLPFGREVPKGTGLFGRIIIDERGVMTVEAKEKENDTPAQAEGRPTLV